MIPKRRPDWSGAAPDFAQVVAFRRPPAPLAMPDQQLDVAFRDPAAPGIMTSWQTLALRAAVLALPVLPAVGVALMAAPWGVPLAVLASFALYWIALPVAVAMAGALARSRPAPAGDIPGLSVAILLPMYGEDAGATILPAVALLDRLAASETPHRFCLRVLSDTRDPVLAQREADLVQAMAGLDITWRRRPQNRDFKSGNLRDWITTEGHRHDAALVLDADSRMGAETVLRLADELAADPGTALLQTVARVEAGHTLWQRLQSFGSNVYGRPLGRGFAQWTGTEGNYLGHNAIFRLGAFARCAGLPHLPGRAPRGGVILSHDFVEAALLRRAGWGVRMLPEAQESFEQAPETLAAHIRRDRRWCQGNLQHLRLLGRPGFHAVSRFHFLQGAMAYLSSLVWLMLLAGYAVLPAPEAAEVGGQLAAAVVALLVAPRLIGLAAHLRGNRLTWRFSLAFLAELVISALLAPVLMVQQTQAVLSMVAGRDGGWVPHAAGRPGLLVLLRLHRWETGLGVGLCGLIGAGLVTPWLLQVGVCLALAVPLSWMVQRDAPEWLSNGCAP